MFFFFLGGGRALSGGVERGTNERPGIWSCDLWANERPGNKFHWEGTYIHSHIHTDGHRNSMTESAQWADSVKSICKTAPATLCLVNTKSKQLCRHLNVSFTRSLKSNNCTVIVGRMLLCDKMIAPTNKGLLSGWYTESLQDFKSYLILQYEGNFL